MTMQEYGLLNFFRDYTIARLYNEEAERNIIYFHPGKYAGEGTLSFTLANREDQLFDWLPLGEEIEINTFLFVVEAVERFGKNREAQQKYIFGEPKIEKEIEPFWEIKG